MGELHIGPVPASAARSWLASARRVLTWIRNNPDLASEVPTDVDSIFDDLLARWEEAADRDPFEWRGEIDTGTLRRLVGYWYRTAAVVLSRIDEPDTPVPPPESEPFRLAVTEAASAAINETGESESGAFGATFKDAWSVPRPRGATTRGAQPLPRVVVVDDSADMRLLLRTALELDGRFDFVGEAVDGAEAIEVCERDRPDLVVLDLRMPGVDGFTALPHLRRGCPDAKIVVFSAEGGPAVEQRVVSLGATRLITKGLPMPELLQTLADTVAA